MDQSRVGSRLWFWVVALGLTGQLAWTIENMYLNVFVYDTITDNPTVLATMVALSAVAATVATLLAGAWSDRTGRRREFIAVGYVLWGATTAAFGLVDVQTAANLVPALDAVVVAIVGIIVLDCVMSALGATANDAAFNAWVTDSTTQHNRGKVDGALATMPLLAMLLVFGALDPLTRGGHWTAFFSIIGGVTALVGVLAWFGLREPRQPRPGGSYFSSVVHGLRPSTIRERPQLYLTLAAWAVLGTSTQVFLPYLIIYVQRFLRIDDYPLVLAATLLSASVLSVLGGRLIDRIGKHRALAPALLVFAAGLLGMFPARGMVAVIAAGIVMMSGMMLATAAVSAVVRDHTPPGRAGAVQGLRMIMVVMVPMIIGPFLGAAVILGADETYLELGQVRQVPTPWIFVAAAVAALLALLPARVLRRMTERRAGGHRPVTTGGER